LPSNLRETFENQVLDDIDILDLRYLERDIPESEYVSSRRTLTDELKVFSRPTGTLVTPRSYEVVVP